MSEIKQNMTRKNPNWINNFNKKQNKELKKVCSLDKADFEFVQIFCQRNNIPEGHGRITQLEVFLNEYKKFLKGVN